MKNVKRNLSRVFFVICFLALFATSQNASAATVYVNSATGNDTIGDGSSSTPYKTFYKGYTAVVSGDVLDLTGTFTWTDADETGDVVTTGYTIGKNLIIQGEGAGQTIIQAASSYAAGDRAVLNISVGYTVAINDLTVRYGYNRTGSNGGGINNEGTLTVNHCDISQNYVWHYPSWDGYGGGIRNAATLTVNDSTINDNFAQSQGGGIVNAYTASGSNVVYITNSTIAFNSTADVLATVGGAGIYLRSGTAYVTNSTIAYNVAPDGTGDTTGIDVNNATLYIKNSIVAGNKVTVSGTDYNVNYASGNFFDITNSGTFHDNGGNIFGKVNTAYNGVSFSATTWYDLYGNGAGDDIFTLHNTVTTGSLYLDSSLADNGTIYGSQTLAITNSNSVAVDGGLITANVSVSIPTEDERGATRNGDTDIGSFEYAGVFNPPVVSSLSPADGATSVAVGANLVITFSESVDAETGGTVSLYKSDDTLIQTFTIPDGGLTGTSTNTITINPTANLSEQTSYYIQISATAFDDVSSNSYAGISDTTTWNFTTGDFTAPTMIITAAEGADGFTSGDATLSLTFTSSEATVNFASGDISVSNGAISSFAATSSTVYTATFTPTTDGAATIDVAGATFTDASTNNNSAATQFNWTYDGTALSVTLSPLNSAIDVVVSSNITITFDGAARNIDDSEITDANVDALITLKDTDASGADITFDATIDGPKQIITIDPTSNFSSEQVVYVAIGATVEDVYDNAITSSNATFTVADAVAPTVSGASPSGEQVTGTSSVTLSVTTNENATCKYSTSSGTAFGSMTVFGTTSTISHLTSISGLINGTSYSYYVLCQDGSNNESAESTISFSVASGGGGATISLPPATGAGQIGINIAIGQVGNIGIVNSKGTNVLTYINSQAKFTTIISNNNNWINQNHKFEIISFDLYLNIMKVKIESEPQIITFSLDEVKQVDLDGDGINDIEIKFEDVYVNRAELTIVSLLVSDEEEEIEANISYENKLVTYLNSPKVYLVENNLKRWIVSADAFISHQYNWNEILEIKDEVFFTDGKNITVENITEPQEYIFIRDLKITMTGEDVKKLQKYLNGNNFIVSEIGYGSNGNETEYFGFATQRALANFQKANNLPAFGFFGPMTRALVN